jgi:hypothetical protein
MGDASTTVAVEAESDAALKDSMLFDSRSDPALLFVLELGMPVACSTFTSVLA